MIIKVIIKVIIKHCGSPLTLRLLSVYPSRPFEGGGRNRPIQLSREPLEFPPSPPPASASPSTSTSLSLLKGLLGDRLRASKLKNESLASRTRRGNAISNSTWSCAFLSSLEFLRLKQFYNALWQVFYQV